VGNYDWNRIETELNAAPQAKRQHVRQPYADQRGKGTSTLNADDEAILTHIKEALTREIDDRA
jgi:hypothetical protein